MVGVDVVVDAEFGIEEVERLVHVVDDALVGVPVDFVRRTVHLDAYMPVLQVHVGAEPRQQVVSYLAIDVEVRLFRLVIIVFVVRHQHVNRTLDPFDQSEVVAFVFVPAAPNGSLQVLLVVIDDGGHSTVEVVVHLLLAHQVALGPSHSFVQVVLEQGTLALVLLVVALSLGVVQCCIEAQLVVQPLVPYQLVVLLVVVVRLVVIVVRLAVSVIILAA